MEFDFNEEKNELLNEKRGITFQEIIEAIVTNGVLLNIKHPNEDKYPDQWMMVVNFNDYTYCVPYVVKGETWFLKTIYPSRKFLYLIGVEGD
ncbi:MAG: toxin [Deltaproteobacteria bacterium]|nr:MAG: toxin [Deltaproteobacteria bacterium]